MAVQVNESEVKTTVRLDERTLSMFQEKVRGMYGKLKGAQEKVLRDAVKLWLGKFGGLDVYAGKAVGDGAVAVVVTPEELPNLLNEGCTSFHLEAVRGSVSQAVVDQLLSSVGKQPSGVWLKRGDAFSLVHPSNIDVAELFGEECEKIVVVWGSSNKNELEAIMNAEAVLTVTPTFISFSRSEV
jgi:hypothetical protein